MEMGMGRERERERAREIEMEVGKERVLATVGAGPGDKAWYISGSDFGKNGLSLPATS